MNACSDPDVGAEFSGCPACLNDEYLYCTHCGHAPEWFAAVCAECGVRLPEDALFADAVFYTVAWVTGNAESHRAFAKVVRTIKDAGAADGYGAAYALGGKPAALDYMRGLGGSVRQLRCTQYVEFAPARKKPWA
jgi:hypothetical protein